MEEMFVSTETNSAGVYGLKFYVNGERKVVLVDDYVPAKKGWFELPPGSGDWQELYRPVYA